MRIRETILRAGRAAAAALAIAAAGGGARAASEEARPEPTSEVFRDHALGVAGLLTSPAGADSTAGLPAVLLVHDRMGVDPRSTRYVDQITAAGFLVLEVEIDVLPLDGRAAPARGEAEAADFVARAANALARHPRVDPRRIGALGFGAGGAAVLRASADAGERASFAARALLYPGCDALRRAPHVIRVAGVASAAARSPVLLLHGDSDAANSPEACDALVDALAEAAPVRRIRYRGAGYAWDLPPIGLTYVAQQPGPDGEGRVIVRSWPGLAEMSAAQVAGFFVVAFAHERCRQC